MYDFSKFPVISNRNIAPDLPTWLLCDKQILTFDGYYQRNHHESLGLTQFTRNVKIYFFIEDGTIKVVEPSFRNSGLTQGTLIGRQKIKLPQESESYFDILDLNVGFQVEFLGKIFQVVDCDNFTRVYLNRLGVKVPDKIPMPKMESVFDKGLLHGPHGLPKNFPFRQFLEFDRKVLRFYGYWDDRANAGGRLHYIVVYYYLSDDSMQINELLKDQSGIEMPSTLISRMKMPKHFPSTIKMTDSPEKEFYRNEDLAIGARIWAFHREIVLTDCDEFTREYYRAKYGMDTFTPLPIPKEKEYVENERILPPWNGYGSYEDSAMNCREVKISTPHPNVAQLLKRDKYGSNSNVLRFAAQLISNITENSKRVFIIKYYLVDETMSIFEITQRNSGFAGGRFASRQTVYMPGVDKFVSDPPPKYLPRDMWIGNVVVVNGRQFLLFTADEYTIRYKELHSEEFPKSNIGLIIDKIRRTLLNNTNQYKDFVSKHMNAVVPERKHLMPLQRFNQAIKEIMGDSITQQEFITISRLFLENDLGRRRPKGHRNVQSLVMAQLVKELWSPRDTDALLLTLRRCDDSGLGTLPRVVMRQALRACRLPIDDYLMDCLLDAAQKDTDGEIRISGVMQFLDFKMCRNLTDMEPEDFRLSSPGKMQSSYDWIEEDVLSSRGYVNWDAFICQLDLEHLLKEQT